MSQKAVVSKPNFNVGTETNPDNLIFSSDYSTLKYSVSGTTSLAFGGNVSIGTWTTTVPHGQTGTTPFIWSFVDFNNAGTYQLLPSHNAGLPFVRSHAVFTDGTNITFRVTIAAGFGTVTAGTDFYKYFIFKNNTGF